MVCYKILDLQDHKQFPILMKTDLHVVACGWEIK